MLVGIVIYIKQITYVFRKIEFTSSCVIGGFFELAAKNKHVMKTIRRKNNKIFYPFEMVAHNWRLEFLIDEHIHVHFQPN